MQGRAALLLSNIGLTRSGGLCIVIYLLVCVAVVQPALPAGNVLLQPVPLLPYLVTALPLVCAMLVVREFQKRPRWRDAGYALLTYTLLLQLFFIVSRMKSTIPFFAPYTLDPWLMRADLWLHFGRTPFDWLAGHLTHPLWVALDWVYSGLWFVLQFFYMVWLVFFCSNRAARTHYLSACTLSWILLGNGLAMALSSAGPIFYSLFFHDTFTAINDSILARVRATGISGALHLRDLLLEWMQRPGVVHLNGISAMPSMHVGVAVLLFLHVRRYLPRFRWAAAAYALVIFLGSILLGWHYAVDGYVSAILVTLIWHLTGWECRPFCKSAPIPQTRPAAPTDAHSSPATS